LVLEFGRRFFFLQQGSGRNKIWFTLKISAFGILKSKLMMS